MPRTAKLFQNGRSQALRLPAEYRFEGSEVYIRRDPKSGDVILSRRPDSWQEFFDLAEADESRKFAAFANHGFCGSRAARSRLSHQPSGDFFQISLDFSLNFNFQFRWHKKSLFFNLAYVTRALFLFPCEGASQS